MGVVSATASHEQRSVRKVQTAEDRFAPFAVTVHVGDAVKWTNGDED
jgi:plastocyanin